jgi:hypothetical protein
MNRKNDIAQKIQEVLRQISNVDAEIGREGLALPDLGRVAAALNQMRPSVPVAPTQDIITVNPTPPPVNLPAGLQARWDEFWSFLTAIYQTFGWPNRDQYLYMAEIAATLTLSDGGGGGSGGGGAPLINPPFGQNNYAPLDRPTFTTWATFPDGGYWSNGGIVDISAITLDTTNAYILVDSYNFGCYLQVQTTPTLDAIWDKTGIYRLPALQIGTTPGALPPATGINITTGTYQLNGVSIFSSPAFTGVPTAPTAAPGTNTTQLATTAFVLANPPATGPYDLGIYLAGTYSNSQIIGEYIFPRTVSFPANMTGSYALADAASTGTVSCTANKNGSSIGTVRFAASATGTFQSFAATTFNAGDVLQLVAPTAADSTLAGVKITFVGTR